jgi:GH24 family phage-related lysozyme (muramidase)
MQQTEKLVKDLVKVKLTESQTAAIVSFVNDRGQTIFKNSNLLKVINKNDLEAVPIELAKWVIENGKVRPELEELRQKEIALFTK